MTALDFRLFEETAWMHEYQLSSSALIGRSLAIFSFHRPMTGQSDYMLSKALMGTSLSSGSKSVG